MKSLMIALTLTATAPIVSAETLMMPNRDAVKNTSLIVWGVTTLPNGTPFSLDFGDGTPPAAGNVVDGSYITASHAYPSSGNFTASLTVGVETGTTKLQVFDPSVLSADEIRNLGINFAIQDGLRYLWQAQRNRAARFPSDATTDWGGSFPRSWAAMITLAFENHGFQLPNNNATPTGLYEKYIVRRGLNFVLDNLARQALTVQPAGDPCVGGVEAAPCVGLLGTEQPGYGTAVAMLPLAASGALARTVAEIAGTANGGYIVGRTYGEVLQRLSNAAAFGQTDCCVVGQGGWRYTFNSGLFDGSTVGWNVLAFLDAAAAGTAVAPFVKPQFAIGLNNALNNDGSFDYIGDGNPASNSAVNVAKTSIGLQGMFFTGTTAPFAAGSKAAAALDFISNRWLASLPGDAFPCNTLFNKGCSYAMFNVFKAFKLQGVVTLPGVGRPAGPGGQPANDWYADYQDWLVANQTAPTTPTGGLWAGMFFSCCANDLVANAAIAELILSPVALVLPDPIKFATLGLQPFADSSTEGGTHTVTAHAESKGGAPVPGVTVNFKILLGPNTGQTGTGTTDAAGNLPYTYTDTGGVGVDTIQAFIPTTPVISSNTVVMTWTPRNHPPVARCHNLTLTADPNLCTASGSIDNGSSDPDAGDAITLVQAPASPYSLGSKTVVLTVTDSHGASDMCSATVTVVDKTAPTLSCVQGVNPAGDNTPRANNPDGFYLISATDQCSGGPALTIKVGSFAIANGETIKITQSPGANGVTLVNDMGPLAIKHFRVGPSDAVITATDGAGNAVSVSCLVPPPPK